MVINPLAIKLLCILLGPLWGLFLMKLGYKSLDKYTSFVISDQIEKNNISIGFVLGCLFIGVGLCV